MVIFIKSFNRPFYLDRCLCSIEKFVDGDKKIIVLDDGTNKRYLKKITQKYPLITILKSEFADEKAEKIENNARSGEPVTGLRLPSKFWRDSIFTHAGDNFLLLEDDMWFVNKFNLDNAEHIIPLNGIILLKLFHFGNKRLLSGKIKRIEHGISKIVPELFTTSPYIFKNLIIRNPLKLFSAIIKLGLIDRLVKINYYTIYNVAGCIFNKDYYAYLWGNTPDKVNEDIQLVKALEYKSKNKNVGYAFTDDEVLRTSFTSSATNMFEDINFDVFRCSYLLSEAWYEERLNVCENLNEDLDIESIYEIIKNDPKTNPAEWEKWKDVFRRQYLAVGHQIK